MFISTRRIFSTKSRRASRQGIVAVALMAVTLTILSALAMSARSWLVLAKEAQPPVLATSSRTLLNTEPGASTKPNSGPAQVVRFALYDVGIYPQEAHARKGLISIAIEDLSGGSQGLVVERQTGNTHERAGLIKRGERYGRGKDTLRLGPGTYQVYDASRPANSALLIIEP